MKKNVQEVALENILDKIEYNLYEYVWINTYDDLIIKPIEEIREELKDSLCNLIEAKFFSNQYELSLIPTNRLDCFSMVKIIINNNMDYVEEIQILTPNKSPFKGNHDKLVIRHYIDYDDEGQAFIQYTKLHDITKGEV